MPSSQSARHRLETPPTAPTGFPSPADDYEEQPLDLNAYVVQQPEATFFMRISDQSVGSSDVTPGDLIVADRSRQPSPGDMIVAAVQGDLVVARLRMKEGRLYLDTPYHDQDETMEVWGKVTHLIKHL